MRVLANLDMDGQSITNLPAPVNSNDAANKAYVDAIKQGLDVKDSVRAASTVNIALTGLQTIDGYTTAENDRVLLKEQTNASENGIWLASSVVWTRASDANTSDKVTSGMFTFVEQGIDNANGGFILTTLGVITLGTTALNFTRFSGMGQINAGNGLVKNGQTINVIGTVDRIAINADSIDIASTYVGQTSITTLGTITVGVWNATTIAVANGGTGATTVAAAKTNLGYVTRLAADIGDGASTSITVTHGLGTDDIIVSVRDKTTKQVIMCDVTHTDANTVNLVFSSAPAAASHRVVIIG